MKIVVGDVFKIETNIGFGFLLFIYLTELKFHYVRVLDFISSDGQLSQTDVNRTEKWCTGFVLNIEVKRHIVDYVGNFKIPNNFQIPRYARAKHAIGNEFIGWHIVDRVSLHRNLVKKLTSKEILLSPHGIMNDTFIIERLEENWSLLDWK